jgi:two-component system, LytTR family, response regulator
LVKNLRSVYHSVWKITADAVLLPAVWTRFWFWGGLSDWWVLDARAERMPLTVFVTAYDEHAIRALEANALDYLLKPFTGERFEMTMARVSVRMDERNVREFGRRILRMVSAAPAGERPLDRLVVKSGGSTSFVRVADIDWIEAAGVYANLHVGGKELLYRRR